MLTSIENQVKEGMDVWKFTLRFRPTTVLRPITKITWPHLEVGERRKYISSFYPSLYWWLYRLITSSNICFEWYRQFFFFPMDGVNTSKPVQRVERRCCGQRRCCFTPSLTIDGVLWHHSYLILTYASWILLRTICHSCVTYEVKSIN